MPAAKRDQRALLSDRLMRALTAEIRMLDGAGRRPAAAAEDGVLPEGAPTRRRRLEAEGKSRLEAISLLVRTLEKVIELGRLEVMQREAERDNDVAETERLRAEMMKRLRALDARREPGGGLFDDEPGGDAEVA